MSSRSVDLVLHWPADKTEKPAVPAFDNNVRPATVNHGRLTVAHTAVVPPADVRVDKKVLFSNIANGEFVSANVPAGTYSVDIVPTGQQVDPLFGPVDLPVRPGLLTRVFAIGEPKNQSMDAVVQTLPLRQAGSPAPDLIDAGSAGLVATNGHPDDTWGGTRDMALAGTAAVVVLGALVAGSGRARRRQALARAVGQLRVGRS